MDKIREREIINENALKTILIQQFRNNMYYIKFSLNEGDSTISKRFERFEDCLELFNRIWCAMVDNESIDISEEE